MSRSGPTTKRVRITRNDEGMRRDLIDRALVFLRANGFSNTTVRALADHLGLHPSNIYYHFPNKDALLVACLDTELGEHIEMAREETSKGTPPQRVRRLVEVHVDFQLAWLELMANDRRAVNSFNSIADSISDETREPLALKQRAFVDILKTILRAGQDSGDFEFEDITIAAFAIISLPEQMIQWFRLDGRIKREEARRMLADLALRMVQSKQVPKSQAKRKR